MNVLAETMISGDWIITLLVAVIGAVGAVWMKRAGLNQGRSERITLGEPMPEVPIKKVFSPPTYHQFRALEDRVTHHDQELVRLRESQAAQFRELLMAGGEREERLSQKLDGIARGLHKRIDAVLLPPSRQS